MKSSKIPLKKLNNFDEAADTILKMIAKLADVNTVFIAKNDRTTNEIVKVRNEDTELLHTGEQTPFDQTFCNLSINHGNCVLLIEDINKNETTKDLEVTKNLGSGSFIGIPINYENGDNYGTICGLDTTSVKFSDDHVELFETASSLLSYVLELDAAHKEITNLSVPLVPITEGIGILPIIGTLNEDRLRGLSEVVLSRSQELMLDYLVIDLSGVDTVDEITIQSLSQLADMLNLLGITPLITGIRSEVAIQTTNMPSLFRDIKTTLNLESALQYIGFRLEKN
ncbi:GAF domain-containing protein [Halobacillus locisalis]|uniref:GAF domain-containing protein n=1 Tax=Halobacillus locisalis TaxID=220753 RepID=A0A838CXA0_9BACI|nr:STAS domain-containing protein [Halobacillus locisalis]MBA2176236.1 GAF domain-containing protein [Halobacillus locisalis]